MTSIRKKARMLDRENKTAAKGKLILAGRKIKKEALGIQEIPKF